MDLSAPRKNYNASKGLRRLDCEIIRYWFEGSVSWELAFNKTVRKVSTQGEWLHAVYSMDYFQVHSVRLPSSLPLSVAPFSTPSVTRTHTHGQSYTYNGSQSHSYLSTFRHFIPALSPPRTIHTQTRIHPFTIQLLYCLIFVVQNWVIKCC